MIAVPRTEKFNPKAVQVIKNIIISEYYQSEKQLNNVILFGRIAVPYSGSFAIDGHRPGHYGAWPADVYYGDIDGIWHDDTTNTVEADYPKTHNVPGDGKFDETFIPSDVELRIGRIDLYDLPYFADSETELLRKYIGKNHKYRIGKKYFSNNAIIDDQFKMYSKEAFAAAAWSGYTPLVGYENIKEGRIREGLTPNKYLWAYGCNSGAFNNVYDVAYANEYAVRDQNAVFLTLLGSFLGDWDSTDNILRAALASQPSMLASCFNGRPYWLFHRMGLGETIGDAALLTQNNINNYPAQGGQGRHGVHIALMGDPTIRIYPILTPTNLKDERIFVQAIDKVKLTWEPSPDPDVVGYNVYKAASLDDKFTKINDYLVSEPFFMDIDNVNTTDIYMVRAMKLEHTASGSFYNLSQGILTLPPPDGNTAVINVDINEGFSLYPNPAASHLHIEIDGNPITELEYSIYDLNGNLIITNLVNSQSLPLNEITIPLMNDSGKLLSQGIYLLKVQHNNIIYHKIFSITK